ncbi:hypothetical protein FRC07_007797 [Ceratobasidium sp. 392]|nr:hypothetical protein FRC07_007797 [Ceratobasidium sp. 392]
MRIAEPIDNGEEQLGLRLEDVVNDDGEGSDDEHPTVELSVHGSSGSLPSTQLGSSQVHSRQGVSMSSHGPDSAQAQQFDHAALEAQITDLLTAEATRPASRAAAAAAAARQRNSNSRAADKAKTTDSRSKTSGDPSSMSFPLSLAATQAYPLPPPPIGYPPQPSENEPTEPDEPMSESSAHRITDPSLPSDHTVNAASVLDTAAGHNSGQPQNFADITDILAHLSAHLENAAAAAAVAAGHAEPTQATVGSSGAEDEDDSPHEGRDDDDDDDETAPRTAASERTGVIGDQEDFSRPFVCDVPNCGKGFGRKSDLARHSGPPTSEVPQAEGSNQTAAPSARPEPAWARQISGAEQRTGSSGGASIGGVPGILVNGQPMDEPEVYPEEWVQDIDGEGDSEEQAADKSPQGTSHTLTQQVPPTISVQAVSH